MPFLSQASQFIWAWDRPVICWTGHSRACAVQNFLQKNYYSNIFCNRSTWSHSNWYEVALATICKKKTAKLKNIKAPDLELVPAGNKLTAFMSICISASVQLSLLSRDPVAPPLLWPAFWACSSCCRFSDSSCSFSSATWHHDVLLILSNVLNIPQFILYSMAHLLPVAGTNHLREIL